MVARIMQPDGSQEPTSVRFVEEVMAANPDAALIGRVRLSVRFYCQEDIDPDDVSIADILTSPDGVWSLRLWMDGPDAVLL